MKSIMRTVNEANGGCVMDAQLPLRKGDKVLVRAEVAFHQSDTSAVVLRVEGDFRDLYVDRNTVTKVVAANIAPGEDVTVSGESGPVLATFLHAVDDHWALVRRGGEDIPAVVARGAVRPVRPALPSPTREEVPEPAPQPAPDLPAADSPHETPQGGGAP
ncbi:MAG: hypothetical protein U1E62_21535 [Alsobacter sp.]